MNDVPPGLSGSSDHERAASSPARGHRFRLRLALFALLVAVPAQAAQAQRVARTDVKPTQRLAALLSAHEAFAAPDAGSAPIQLVPARGPLTAERTVLPVLTERTGWLRVRLPGRPNGHAGWIKERGTRAATTRWHIVVDTARRRVIVYRSGRSVRTVSAVVGKPSTPTPHGEFFIEESILLRSFDVGAPFALALSARSNVLQEFEGGPGQIALHGLVNVGGVPGTAVSHGCVRLDTDTMRWLVLRIGPGVPVTVTG